LLRRTQLRSITPSAELAEEQSTESLLPVPSTSPLLETRTQVEPFGSEFILPNATGTFSEGGTTYTVDPIFGIISNPDPLFPRVGFFNSDITNGLTINNSALTGYNLGGSLGPITAPKSGDPSSFLLPTLGGTTGFSLDSGLDKLILTSNDSLTFTAAPPSAVPEPSTFALLTAGIAGIGVLRRRFSL
jgi:hypothetical protein